MRGILTFSVVALSTLFLAGDAEAQRGGGGGFGGGFGGMGGSIQKVSLLRLESVQDELGLDESQLEQIQALRGGRGERGRRPSEGRQNLRGLDEEDRREAIEVRRQEAAQLRQEQEEKLAGILGPDKIARLNQIYIQASGVVALQDPSVVEALVY